MQFLLVSSSMHVCILLAMFVWYRGRDNHSSVMFDRALLAHGIPVVIVSRTATTTTSIGAVSPTIKKVATQAPEQQLQRTTQSNTSAQSKKASPKTSKTVAAQPVKAQPKTTLVTKEKLADPVIAKKKEPKIVPQKQQPQVIKETPKQVVEPEKIAPKVEEKKVAEKKQNTPQKIVKNDSKQQIIEPTNVAQSAVPKAAQTDDALQHIDGPIIVAKDYREKAQIKKHLLLQQELVRVWHPPVGIHDGCQCQLRVAVGSDGAVRNVRVVDSSGVLMFDIAARSALCSAQMPKWTWGTSIDITFS